MKLNISNGPYPNLEISVSDGTGWQDLEGHWKIDGGTGKGTVGELWDRSRELSEKRKDKLGYDPVKKKYLDDLFDYLPFVYRMVFKSSVYEIWRLYTFWPPNFLFYQ